jgi:uncharacterized membrane protein
MNRLAIGLLVLTLISAVVQAVWWSPQLPARVPTHFGPNGQPDGWSTPTQMIVSFVGLQFTIAGAMVLLAYFLSFIPDSMINVPNREYWLSPERREATLRDMRGFLGWMAIATSWLMIGMFQLSALVAVQRLTSISPAFWLLIGVYLTVIFGGCGWLVYKYRLPRDAVTRR